MPAVLAPASPLSVSVPYAAAAELWTRRAAGDQAARDQLVRENLGLVYHVAQRVARTLRVRAELADLVSAGTLGLMQAVDAFDPARGRAFSTFAARRIRGAMLDEVRALDHAPRSVRRKARLTAGARDALARAHGRAPTSGEVAAQLGVDAPTLRQWETAAQAAHLVPLDAPRGVPLGGAQRGAPLAEALAADDDGAGVEDRLSREQEAASLRAALLRLPEQQRTVLALYYFEELTLLEIATVIGRTESRVSQIRTKALATLRAALRGPARRAA